MKIDEKNVDVIVDALITKIKDLELELWCRDEKIKKLQEENAKKENGNETV